MQAQLIRIGLIVGVAAVTALSVGYTTRQMKGVGSPPPPRTEVVATDPRITPPPWTGQGAPQPLPHAVPVTDGPIRPLNVPPLDSPPPKPPLRGLTVPNIPGIDPHDPSTWPLEMRPPAAAGEPTGGGAPPPGDKVLSYFQQTKTHIDTKSAFGFILFPRAAVTAQEKQAQKDFCEIVLASMDFMTPGAVSASIAEHHAILATYWPIESSRNSFEVSTAFAARDCDDLIAWFDHKLARALASKAGVAHLGGPLLITWPSSGANEEDRDPLVVDFSKANHERATKALQYWFRQLRNKPALWTSRIREGTIRAELADAVNNTAGVMLAVLSGKWESLTAVGATATP